MKPFFTFLLVWTLPFLAITQSFSFEVTVHDAVSNEPLPYATVYLKRTGAGTTTDPGGVARLSLAGLTATSDTLVCSYVGYQTVEVPLEFTNNRRDLEVALFPQATALREVVVIGRRPLSPKQILKRIVRNTPDNYPEDPFNFQAFYRETIRENGRYIQLNEAVTEIHYTGYPQQFDRRIWRDWYYDDRYALNFKSGLFFEVTHHFNTQQEQASLLGSRSSANGSTYDYETAITGGPLALTALDLVKYQCDFLNPRLFNKYHYTLLGEETINGVNCYVLQFYPKQSGRRMIFDMGRKLNRAIYVGRLYVDIDSFAVVKLAYQLAKNVDFGFYSPRIPLAYRVTVDYRRASNRWRLDRISLDQTRSLAGQYLGLADTSRQVLYQGTQEMWVQRYQPSRSIPEKDQLKHTRLTTLRYLDQGYDPEFWVSVAKSNIPEQPAGLIDDLSTQGPLELQFRQRFQYDPNQQPPVPTKRPYTFRYPFVQIEDSLHWLAQPEYREEAFRLLRAENRFTENALRPFQQYRREFFQALNTFYPEKDSTSPKKPGTLFLDEDTLSQETILWEQLPDNHRKPVFNYTRFLEARPKAFISDLQVSEKLVSATYTQDGGQTNHLVWTDKASGQPIDSVNNVYSYAWLFPDSVLLYTQLNPTKRADRLYLHRLAANSDSLLMTEPDSTFDLSVEKTGRFLKVTAESKDETEIYLVDPANSELRLIQERRPGIQYRIKVWGDTLFMLTNEQAINRQLLQGAMDGKWKVVVPGKANVLIDNFWVTENYLILQTLKESYPQISHRKKGQTQWQNLLFPDSTFEAFITPKGMDSISISYSAPLTPFTNYRLDLTSGQLLPVTQTSINPKIDLNTLTTRRLWARDRDTVRIPITMIGPKDPQQRHGGLILRVYGAYGALTGSYFSAEDIVLAKMGFVIAYAHVRGERILGNQWYQNGKKLNKENSFADYLTCAEYLIREKWTTPDKLVAYGNSAGGLVVGVALNRRPDLFGAAVLERPYLDVLTTMMDPSLPLTTDEYKEWGNPKEKNIFNYIHNYSPYQGIRPQAYPPVYLTASTNDYQTPFWQIAKYAFRLRASQTGKGRLVLHTDFGSGHLGSTTGKEWLIELANQYAFIRGQLELDQE